MLKKELIEKLSRKENIQLINLIDDLLSDIEKREDKLSSWLDRTELKDLLFEMRMKKYIK